MLVLKHLAVVALLLSSGEASRAGTVQVLGLARQTARYPLLGRQLPQQSPVG